MEKAKKIITEHLSDLKIMQLATAANNQPWVCNVHFVHDADLNLYWMSAADCRHSREIAQNPRVAATMAVNVESPLIGVQIEGDAAALTDIDAYKDILRLYGERHGRQDMVEKILAGRITLDLYKLTPRLLAVFDQKNFPKDPRQEWPLL